MRIIRNLAWFLLAFTLTVWAGFATAQTVYPYPAVPTYRVVLGSINATGPYFAVRAEACQAFAVVYNAQSTSTAKPFEVLYCSQGIMQLKSTKTSTTVSGSWSPTINTCPKGGRYSSGNCVKDAAYPDVPDDPPPPPPGCPDDIAGEGSWYAGKTGAAYPAKSVIQTGGCVNGCRVDVQEVKRCWSSGGNDYCRWSYTGGGATCQAGEAPEPSDVSQGPEDPRVDVPPIDASPCPKGTVNGGISDTGLQRCIGTGTDPKNKPPAPPKMETEKTETAEDGTKTTTKTEVTTNGDGSKTTTTTVTITKPDGTKQVDQQKDTSKTPANQPGKDDSTKDDEKYDLCKQNPHLTMCQNSSVAGKCGETSCTGDAIQCATLRAAAAMQCQQQKDLDELSKSSLRSLGENILAGNDPMKGSIEDALRGTEIDVSTNFQLDDSGFLGGGSCLKPVSFAIFGSVKTMSFDALCQDAQVLRYVIMAVAHFLAFMIVGRSIIGGD